MGQSPEALRDEIAGTRQDMSDTLEAIGDHVSPGRIIERRKNRVANSVQQLRERVMGSASDTASSISDATGSVADSARQAPQAVAERTQGSPLVMGAVAFGLGFVAAAVFPASRPEKEATGQLMAKAEPLTGRAEERRSGRRRHPQGAGPRGGRDRQGHRGVGRRAGQGERPGRHADQRRIDRSNRQRPTVTTTGEPHPS